MKAIDNLYFSIYIEKIKNKGEDAKPLVVTENSNILLGVFDGLGGAGSIQKYKIGDDKDYKSGAYIASRVVKNTVKAYFEYVNLNKLLNYKFSIYSFNFSFFKDKKIDQKNIEKFIKGLEQDILESLELYENSYADNSKSSLLKSKSVNLLPTTMALMSMIYINERRYIFTFWAGDSRNYILYKYGLSQLTIDDIDDFDCTLNAINSNAPMNNYISLSKDFRINYRYFKEEEEKQILISATDGAFGVFDTPLEFEFMIIQTMQNSNSVKMWNEQIKSILKERQNDDISLIVYPVGFSDFNDIKNFYRERFNILSQKIESIKKNKEDIKRIENKLLEIQEVLQTNQKLFEQQLNRDWEEYRNLYLNKFCFKKDKT